MPFSDENDRVSFYKEHKKTILSFYYDASMMCDYKLSINDKINEIHKRRDEVNEDDKLFIAVAIASNENKSSENMSDVELANLLVPDFAKQSITSMVNYVDYYLSNVSNKH